VVTLDNTDISGLGSLAVVNDAPSDGSQYARKNGAWDVVSAGAAFISSVSSPLSVTTGNLTIDLSAYAPLASPAFTGTPTAPTPSPGTDSTRIATTEWVKDFDYAPTNSPHFTGNPKSVTPSTGDDDTSIATTAFVKAQNYITSSALTPYLTTATAASTYYLQTNPSGFQTAADVTTALSPYLLSATAATTYYPLVGNPSGFLTSAPVTSVAGKVGVVTLDNTDISGLGTMSTATAADYSTTTVANGLYYPLSGNPSSFLVAADITGKANLASPSFTGNVTITTNSASPALFVTQTGTGNILTLHDQASDTTFVAIDQNGKVNTIASTTAGAGFFIKPGTAPTTPINGDVWLTTGTAGVISYRAAATTQTIPTRELPNTFTNTNTFSGTFTASGTTASLGTATTASNVNVGTGAIASGTKTVNIGTAGTTGSTTNINIGTTGGGTSTANVNALLISRASTATQAGLRILPGVAPTSPVNGDIWTTTAGAFARINGATRSLAAPNFATTAEINSPSATDKVVSPWDVVRMITNPAVFDTQSSSPVFSASGTGAEAYKFTNDRVFWIGTPNVGVAGWGQMVFETTASQIGVFAAKRGTTLETQDYNKRIWMAGTVCFNSIGDANTTCRLMLGGRNTFTTGSPTKQSVGWRVTGGGGNPLVLVTYGWNGSALVVTETTSTFTPVLNQTFDWAIYHAPNVANPATSFCYLYVNDVLVATGNFAPADATVEYNYYVHTCEATASQATRMSAQVLPTKIWWSKS
jgi:hypothetical protein